MRFQMRKYLLGRTDDASDVVLFSKVCVEVFVLGVAVFLCRMQLQQHISQVFSYIQLPSQTGHVATWEYFSELLASSNLDKQWAMNRLCCPAWRMDERQGSFSEAFLTG
jgi:hypothetical protein